MKKVSKIYDWFKSRVDDHPVIVGSIFTPSVMLLLASAIHHFFKIKYYDMSGFITPSLVFLGAVFAAMVAVRNTNAAGNLARDKATLDLILKEETDQFILEKRKNFLTLRSKGNLVTWALNWGEGKHKPLPDNSSEATQEQQEEMTNAHDAIGFVLNKYEMIAIGVRNKILSEKIYDEWLGTTIINDWHELAPFVAQIRESYNRPNLYKNFEKFTKTLEEKHREQGL